jgi:hypothetical protein
MTWKYYSAFFSFALAIELIFFTSCNRNPKLAQGSIVERRSMVEILDSLYRNQKFPQSFTRNDLGVKFYKRQIEQSAAKEGSVEYAQNYLHLADQLVSDGSVDSAINIYKELFRLIDTGVAFRQMPKAEVEDARNLVTSQIALAFLRQGELKNCANNHNATSCILPFTTAAFHADPTGSDSALSYLLQYLYKNPGDNRAMWLANITALTIHKYPEAIPPKFRVDFEKYSSDAEFPHFDDIAFEKGVNRLGHYGGVDVEDFNNDGLPDIFVTSGSLNENVHLYLQTKDKGFIDYTEQAGLKGITGGVNTVHADFDNDGLTDIYIMRGGWQGAGGFQPNSLLKNLGNGKFEDVTIKAGLLSYKITHTACWGDFNNDGWLDLFVGHENKGTDGTGPYDNCNSELFLNNHDGTFTEVSVQCGMAINDWVKGATWLDYNNDGYLDLYVSNYGSKNLLFRNDGPDAKGQWHFTEVGQQAGVQDPSFSFSVAAFDINQDGWDDLFVPGYNIDGEIKLAQEYKNEVPPVCPAKIFINQHDGTFKEMADSFGIHRSIYAMSLNYGDLDLDGYPDVYLGTGNADLASLYPNILLKNVAGKKFADVTSVSGTGNLQKGHGIAISDIDHDGDNDIYAEFGGFLTGDAYWNAYFENPGNGNQWISLKLEGTKVNRSAIGSRIKITVNGDAGKHDVFTKISTGGSYGCSSLQQLIGLGKAKSIESVEVIWPGNQVPSVYHNLELKKAYLIKQGSESPQPLDYTPITGNAKSAGSQMHH